MKMNPRIRFILVVVLVVVAVILGLSQLQPLVLRSVGAVDGSFGIRPVSHECLGLTIGSEKSLSRLPPGDVEFQLGRFHFRYFISAEDGSGQRPICVGQDVWYGE
jgi:hypothetical protein